MMINKCLNYLATLLIGFLIGFAYYVQNNNENVQNFGSRDIESEIKAEVNRVNLILNDSEKKHIIKTIPKPVNPASECKCNGTKEIVHGDGHKTPCICSSIPGGCKCLIKQEIIQGTPQ